MTTYAPATARGALDRRGRGELAPAETLDEVAAPGGAERLEVRQLSVEGGEPAGNPLGERRLPGHDPVALEQQLAQRPHCCSRRARLSRGARSGAKASFVSSPAHTRSHSASWSSSGSASLRSASKSLQKAAPAARRSRRRSCSGPAGGSPRAGGGPSQRASSRK